MHENSLKNLTYRIKKGSIPWNKGTKGIMKANKTSFSKGRKDNTHPEWKGLDASYNAKHAWVARWLGKPKLCADCGAVNARSYNWANISGNYLRDLSDWKRLCRKCHHKFDKISEKIWKKRKKLV